MDIREYRRKRNLTQPQLAEELKKVVEGIDAPLISKMEKGLCEPPLVIRAYLDAKEKELDRIQIELTPVQGNILSEIMLASKDAPCSRKWLAIASGMTDRTVRREIEQMRKRGIRICSDSKSYGYWLAKSETEYKDFRKEIYGRAMTLLQTVSAMDNYTEGQVSLGDR